MVMASIITGTAMSGIYMMERTKRAERSFHGLLENNGRVLETIGEPHT